MPETKGVPRPSGLMRTIDLGLLAARAGDGGVNHAAAADGWAGDGMQAFAELAGNAQGRAVA